MQQLSQLYNTVQSAGAALNKIFGVLDTRPSIAERPGAVDLPADGAVEVDHVTFAYGQDPVLHDLSLTIAAGERIALVGPTGAGKSTLAKLIARFYDPTEGDVRVDGVDLRDATLRSLRERDRRRTAGGLPVRRESPRQRAHRPARSHRRRGR